jgi:hypothetical protein
VRATSHEVEVIMKVIRSKRAVALVAASALLVAAGVAYATIPDSSGVVNTCYANEGGALRAVDDAGECLKDETHLPLGSPTRGYASANLSGDVELADTSRVVSSVILPAGTYLAHAKVNVVNLNFRSLGSTFVPCSMRIAGTSTNLDQTWIVLQQAVTSTGISSASIGLQAAVTIPSEKAVLEVICASIPRAGGPATRVFARYRQLDAISVDTLATAAG